MIPSLAASAIRSLPLVGRDQGRGSESHDIGANPHPLPASPIKGEVSLHSRDSIEPNPQSGTSPGEDGRGLARARIRWLNPPLQRPVENLQRAGLGEFDRIAAVGGIDDGHVADQLGCAAFLTLRQQ